MSMTFKGQITGDISLSGIELDDLGFSFDAEEVLKDNLSYDTGGTVTIEDANVFSATVTIEARAIVDDIEVEVGEYDTYDADDALNAALGYDAEVNSAAFEVTEGPTGFDVIENMLGRENAVAVYVALANAGFEVS